MKTKLIPVVLATLLLSSALSIVAPVSAHEGEAPIEAKPNESNVDYFWRKSDVAFHAGDYERAVGLHKAIVILDPTEIESYSVGSWLLWSLGKADESNAFIQRGIENNPSNTEMWDAAGQHFDLQKRYLDSKVSYKKAVELAGKDADQLLRRRLAHASEKSGDLSGSIAVWQGLVTDFPNEAVNKNNLARVQELSKTGNKASLT
jgi:tetratricopeptide (TPR) repeat protein